MRQQPTSWLLFLLALLVLVSFSSAATPTSFCKCTCFGNSSIVALDAPIESKKPDLHLLRDRTASARKTCNDCNRVFCLSYSFCKGEVEENVVTTCFQRDSAKDQAVVWIFILATVGLLSYAGVRPWIDTWAERARNRGTYIPVANQGGQ